MSQVIDYNGRKLRTNWPHQAFRTTINITIVNGYQAVNNATKCLHCDNVGIVMLDNQPRGVACPMCSLGRLQNQCWIPVLRKNSEGRPIKPGPYPIEEWCWKPSDDISQYTWNNGCSIYDIAQCIQCESMPARPQQLCAMCRNSKGETNVYNPAN